MTPDPERYLVGQPEAHLRRPLARVQPVQAAPGRAGVDLTRLEQLLGGVARLEPLIVVESPESWIKAISALSANIDAILPISIPAYPTEVWNSHPQPLIERKIPVLFWPLLEYDEPDFWRWSARDFLRALGVHAVIAQSFEHGRRMLRAWAVGRMLARSRMVVFGEQNFPWNASAAGHLVRERLGTEIMVRPLSQFRDRYSRIAEHDIEAYWRERKARYRASDVSASELQGALRTALAIREVLAEEGAAAFGVNCFGDLVLDGSRDVPCLAQALLREEGYVAACDGDYLAMMSMMFITHMLDSPCMMSNMYPVQYVGALKDHFGDPLSPDAQRYPKKEWHRLARLAHCGYIGVVSPEMTPGGITRLSDWGGTYEIKRDGRGCGLDGDFVPGKDITVVELTFDAATLLLARARVLESTRHPGLPHCESSALLEFRDLEGFIESISREHTAVVYGDHVEQLSLLAEQLGLETRIF